MYALYISAASADREGRANKRDAHHNGEDAPIDDALRQPGLELQLSKGTLACNQLANACAEESSHCSTSTHVARKRTLKET